MSVARSNDEDKVLEIAMEGGAENLSDNGEHPVLVRRGTIWGCAFHPELTNDDRVHRLFVDAL